MATPETETPTMVGDPTPMFDRPLDQLATALAKAQAAMEGAVKDSTNPHFQSRYADLASVWGACRAALTANGLAVVQAVRVADGRVYVRTILLHASGQWISSELGMQPVDLKPQAIGSCITYGRRYGLAAMVGVAPEDDDGEGAEGRKEPTGPAGSVTPAQAKFLRTACEKAGIPTTTLCTHFVAETIEDIAKADFDAALSFVKKATK